MPPILNPGAASGQSPMIVNIVAPHKQTFNFQGLPLELREMVYKLVFEDLPTRLILDRYTEISPYAIVPGALPSICFTSKDIWTESVLAYLRRTRLVLHEGPSTQPALIEWLSTFPNEQGFHAIRMLSLLGFNECIYRFEINNLRYPDGLISHCLGLRSLILEVCATVGVIFGAEKDRGDGDGEEDGDSEEVIRRRDRLGSAEEIEQYFQYDGLCSMPNLKHVKFLFYGWNGFEDLGTKEEIFAQFIKNIREGFERHGATPGLVFEYRALRSV